MSKTTTTDKRERLIDDRDQLVALVTGYKRELQAALERRCNQGLGSAKAIWQTIAAIRRGEGQITLIDLQLKAIGTP
jgi:hypothetical protein